MRNEKVKELLKKLNGLEVTWISEDGEEVPAIVLADWNVGVSIKPLLSFEELKKIIPWATEIPTWGTKYFCLTVIHASGLRRASYFQTLNIRCLLKILKTNRRDYRKIPVDNGRAPICVF